MFDKAVASSRIELFFDLKCSAQTAYSLSSARLYSLITFSFPYFAAVVENPIFTTCTLPSAAAETKHNDFTLLSCRYVRHNRNAIFFSSLVESHILTVPSDAVKKKL
jgi:hypothetical protein